MKLIHLTILSGLLMTQPAAAQQVFATWDSMTTFSIDTITGTAGTSNTVDATNSLLSGSLAPDGSTFYPESWFTPTPPVGMAWSLNSIDNTIPGNPGSVDVTVTFSQAVENPRFHFVNLDAGTVDFGAITVTRLSGNPEFEVTGSVANAITAGPINSGCEDAIGANPNGACGTVELAGSFTSLTFTVTDEDTVIGSGDGFLFTLSADPTRAPAVDVPTASTLGLALLALLLATAALHRLWR